LVTVAFLLGCVSRSTAVHRRGPWCLRGACGRRGAVRYCRPGRTMRPPVDVARVGAHLMC